MKIAFYDAHKYEKKYFDEENKNYGYVIDYFDFKLTEKTAETCKGYDAVCVFVNDVLDKFCIQTLAMHGVQTIILRCAGFNNVDLDTAAELGIKVVRVPSYSPEAIAEHTVALILALTRKIPQAFVRTKGGNFTLDGLEGRNLSGRTAGIIGTGRIGKIVARICKGLGMNVIMYDKNKDMYWANSNGFDYCPLKEVFMYSDVISLHCPLNMETKYIINEKSLKMMKRDAVLVNTGRGGLINTYALVSALKEKKIGGAALDVYEEESKYFFNDWSEDVIDDEMLIRLLTFPNVIITSHQAFLTDEALREIAKTSLENVTKLLKNEGGANLVVA